MKVFLMAIIMMIAMPAFAVDEATVCPIRSKAVGITVVLPAGTTVMLVNSLGYRLLCRLAMPTPVGVIRVDGKKIAIDLGEGSYILTPRGTPFELAVEV